MKKRGKRIRRQADLTLGTQTAAAAIMGSSFYHVDTGVASTALDLL